MKKSIKTIGLVMAAGGVLMMASCAPQAPKATLKTEADSLAYTAGITFGQGMGNYIEQQGVTDANMKDFIAAFIDGASDTSGKAKATYLGYAMAQDVEQMNTFLNERLFDGDSTKSINKNNLIAGLLAAATGKDSLMSAEDATAYFEENMNRIMYGSAKEEAAAFLEENKSKEGVVTLPSGLQYEVITEGKGKKPAATDVVKVHYTGTLVDGTQFDSSYQRGEPAQFPLDGVIQGWTEGIQLMPVGSKYKFYIPSDLGYGEQGSGPIPPHSTLIFEVELLGIEK